MDEYFVIKNIWNTEISRVLEFLNVKFRILKFWILTIFDSNERLLKTNIELNVNI